MSSGPGTVGEEAAKLLDALGAWVRGGGLGDDLHAAFDRMSGPGEGGHAVADGSPACRLCPVCQLIALLRQARPETFAHLLDASTALTAALRSLLEHAEATRSGAGSGIQRIDLDPPGQAASSA